MTQRRETPGGAIFYSRQLPTTEGGAPPDQQTYTLTCVSALEDVAAEEAVFQKLSGSRLSSSSSEEVEDTMNALQELVLSPQDNGPEGALPGARGIVAFCVKARRLYFVLEGAERSLVEIAAKLDLHDAAIVEAGDGRFSDESGVELQLLPKTSTKSG